MTPDHYALLPVIIAAILFGDQKIYVLDIDLLVYSQVFYQRLFLFYLPSRFYFFLQQKSWESISKMEYFLRYTSLRFVLTILNFNLIVTTL